MTDRPNDMTAADALLLGDLKEALIAARPVPAGIGDLAAMTFAWRTVDEELALLSFDSTESLMAVRSDTTVRTLSYELEDLTIDLQVHVTERTLIGQIDPEAEGTATLIHRDGVLDTPIEDLGTFGFDNLPAGPIAIRVTLGDRVVRTEWFLV